MLAACKPRKTSVIWHTFGIVLGTFSVIQLGSICRNRFYCNLAILFDNIWCLWLRPTWYSMAFYSARCLATFPHVSMCFHMFSVSKDFSLLDWVTYNVYNDGDTCSLFGIVYFFNISPYFATSDLCSGFHSPNLKEACELVFNTWKMWVQTRFDINQPNLCVHVGIFGDCFEDPN